MYEGYLALGDGTVGGVTLELINNNRVIAYIDNHNSQVRAGQIVGVCHNFLEPCNECPDIGRILTNDAGYNGIEEDPAPWFVAAPGDRHDDSIDFKGILGLEVTGIHDSTLTAEAYTSIGDQGVVGRAYKTERNMTVRALVVAVSECGFSYAMRYLRTTYQQDLSKCGGDELLFFGCCPICDLTDQPGVLSCWPETYLELSTHPDTCDPAIWWPSTYQELKDGPPNEDDWCRWVATYKQLRDGPAKWNCEAKDCLEGELWKFKGVRITGLTLLSRRITSTGAHLGEVEFEVVAANPNWIKVTDIDPLGQTLDSLIETQRDWRSLVLA